MEKDKNKDLLYQPNLGYEKNYYTQGDFNSNKTETSAPKNTPINNQDIVDDLLTNIDNKIKYMPGNIINSYFAPYFAMKDQYKKLKEEYKEPFSPEPTPPPDSNPPHIKIDIVPEPDPDPDQPPVDLFYRPSDIYVDVKDPFADPVKIIKYTYYFDFIDIYKDYLKKTNQALENYLYTILQTVQNSNVTEFKNNYDTADLKNQNLSHLTDYLAKSKIMLDQKMRLHKKLYDIDQIIYHIRAIRSSKDQMLRYNSNKELEQKNFLDADANIILKESIRIAQKKYEENLYGLYKYLNSSVILLNESLKTMTKRNKAQIIINMRDKGED